MAPPEKESESSGITGTLAAVGIVCGFVGAVVGAFGWNAYKKEEMQQQYRSSSGLRKSYNIGPCPICLSDMEELTVLPCGHQYHSTCVEELLKKNGEPKCPVCRKVFHK